MGINPDSMFPTDEPEGSNPTPHPMPVPELSDSVSKRRLEHGPGLHDSVLDLVGVINPDSMRPAVNSFRGCVPTDPCSMLLTPVEDSDVAALSGQTIGEADSFFDIFTELSRVGDEPRDIVDSAQVVNPDSMRPADEPEGFNPQPYPGDRLSRTSNTFELVGQGPLTPVGQSKSLDPMEAIYAAKNERQQPQCDLDNWNQGCRNPDYSFSVSYYDVICNQSFGWRSSAGAKGRVGGRGKSPPSKKGAGSTDSTGHDSPSIRSRLITPK